MYQGSPHFTVRHLELVSGSYFSGAEKIRMLKQVQHDGGLCDETMRKGRPDFELTNVITL